ncbi:unnamed protein product [Trichobilharzia szidati]|nr:unnamed protein product [Trichobilharzia szidati]
MFVVRIEGFMVFCVCLATLLSSTDCTRILECNIAACEQCSVTRQFSVDECCSNAELQSVCEKCEGISETLGQLSDCLASFAGLRPKRRGMIGKRRGFLG